MKSIFSLILFLLFCFSYGQTTDIVSPDRIENTVHKNYLNKIIFLDKTILLEDLKESDIIKSIVFDENKDLDIRVFQNNSLINYLHQLDTSLSVDELIKKGNYQFSFFVDGKLIYLENLNIGSGTLESKKSKTTFRIPLQSSTNEDSWGRYLWMRFYLKNNGIDVLQEGNHLMSIQIRPYLKTATLKIGPVIAQGEINLIIPKKNISEQQIMIQKIQPNSGWSISNEKFDTEKIRIFNRKIAENRFRDITSVVIIKNGRLLLEEYFNSGRDSLQDTRSVGKSFSSAITGIAIQDGFLKSENQRISEFYNLKKFEEYSSKKDSVTIKSLLTMSSGFDGSDEDENSPGNEENMYPTNNWIKFALDLPMTKDKIGKNWVYFTAGVIIIGDILNKSLPNGLENYTDSKLFQPLGIKNYHWQYTPQHKVSMAGGLRMRSLDFAKFGQLYQNKGKFNGKTIIDQNWINKSFTNYFSENKEFEGYGYLFWKKIYKVGNQSFEAYQCSGNGGNKIIMFTKIPIVVVITAKAYNRSYAHSQVEKIVQDYLLPAVLNDKTAEK